MLKTIRLTNANGLPYRLVLDGTTYRMTRVGIRNAASEPWTIKGLGDVEALLTHYSIGTPMERRSLAQAIMTAENA